MEEQDGQGGEDEEVDGLDGEGWVEVYLGEEERCSGLYLARRFENYLVRYFEIDMLFEKENFVCNVAVGHFDKYKKGRYKDSYKGWRQKGNT